jgi:hypothetical protein
METTVTETSRTRVPRRLARCAAVVAALLLLVPATAASAQEPPYDRGIERACSAEARGFDPFPDTAPGTHYEAINCIAYLGVTQGTIRGGVPHYLPGSSVTRAQMASFVARVLDATEPYDLPQATGPAFPDVGGGPHAERIDQLAAAGIVEGREDGTYAPNRSVLRGQMASYIARSIEQVTGQQLPEADVFSDLAPPHDRNVRKLASVGIVQGIEGSIYGPARAISRQEMATFLARTMDHLVDEGYEISATTPVFPQPVGSFSTPLQPGEPRNHNIQLAADIIDGDVIAPGGTYSLDQSIGERTAARGFRSNGFIDEDGDIISVIGGGVSQVATTFFNAAWFTGIDLVEHQPHSQYLDRYPPGREATIAWQLIDVVVRNDTPFPIEIATSHSESQVTVTFIGTPWFEVTETWDDAPAGVSSGDAFSVSYGRTVVAPDGSSSQDSFSWTYEAA